MSDTYSRRLQLGASRRRLEDALALHNCKRWWGAVYLGGYAIECALKSLICYEEHKSNFKETSVFEKGKQGASLHNLEQLFCEIPKLQRTISIDRTLQYKNAWHVITSTWRNDEIRYSDKLGDKASSTKFIHAVEMWHKLLLNEQGEAS